MTTSTNRAQFDANLLYQLAANIENGAYISTLRLTEFLNHLQNTDSFVKGFDPIEAMGKFNFDGDANVV